MLKTITVDGIEFTQKEVVLPVSIPGGSKKKLLGFDAGIYQVRKPVDPTHLEKVWAVVGEMLEEEFGEVFQVSSTGYHINSLDLHVESRLGHLHNFNAYQPTNKFHIDVLNQLVEADQTDTIRQWCILDPAQRNLMASQNKKFLEVFAVHDKKDLLDQVRRATTGLVRHYDDAKLEKEMHTVRSGAGNYNSTPNYNKLVTHFNKAIFTNENKHYSDPIKRRRQIENCLFLQYIPEHELTDEKILVNYRFNKYVPYYSYFSPLWAKKFIEEYSPKRVLDIFGGWGHRYLAFLDVEYIYNDFWDLTYNGVRNIHQFCAKRLPLPAKTFFNEDAGKFAFNEVESYDTVFTCPPYENLESYNNKTFRDLQDFMDLWDRSVANSVHKDLEIFAFIVKNTLADDMVKICGKHGLELVQDQPLGAKINHHYNRLKNVKKLEHLYVLKQIKTVLADQPSAVGPTKCSEILGPL